ncbi:MAG TPA: DUF2293 domain-containing protein [Anaerolineae bacterium]|nr:DUF2293 domain-containing protein [Anaerolineae bacterium]
MEHGLTRSYDELLMQGLGRHDARSQVRDRVRHVLARWQGAAE